MHAGVMMYQQAAADRTTRSTTERPERAERPERREQPERPEPRERPEPPERAESPDVMPGRTARDELRDLTRAEREVLADIRRNEENQANQVIIRNGVPVPPVPAVPGIEVHTGGAEHMIPPQVVDLAYGAYAMLAVMVIGWPLARAWGRRLERSTHAPGLSPMMGEQLQRIEQTVESMAIEVERISEAQRYLAKVQSAQLGEPAALPSSETR